MPAQLQPTDALIVVDVQNDFCPGGALAVPAGDEVVPELNRWLHAAQQGGAGVFATRDWHPSDHTSFTDQGGPWPPHCVQNTPGAEFHTDLELPMGVPVISKGVEAADDSYSNFAKTDLDARLRAGGATRLWIGGLALDYCVLWTALEAVRLGYEVHLIAAASRSIATSPEDVQKTIAQLRDAGVIVEGSA